MNWRARARNIQKGAPCELTKPPKPPFVSSVSSQEGGFESFQDIGATDPRLRNPAFRRQVIAARDAAPLADYREALILGKLVICANCSRFTFGADPGALGRCTKWSVEAWAFTPFWCAGFEVSKTPTAPAFAPDRDGARARAREFAKPIKPENPA